MASRREPWNDKNLDYEIETASFLIDASILDLIETTRTSITRLKQRTNAFSWVSMPSIETTRTSITRLKHYDAVLSLQFHFITWNDKNLDYEIETWLSPINRHSPSLM